MSATSSCRAGKASKASNFEETWEVTTHGLSPAKSPVTLTKIALNRPKVPMCFAHRAIDESVDAIGGCNPLSHRMVLVYGESRVYQPVGCSFNGFLVGVYAMAHVLSKGLFV